MIMRVGEAAERGAYRQPGDDVDLRIRRSGYSVQDDAAPVIHLLEPGVASLIADGVQRHIEADGDACLLSHLPHGAGGNRLPDLDLSFRQRPVVVALAMDDQHLGAPRLVLSGYHSAAG